MRFGAHESIAGGLHLAFARGEAATCEVLQVFVKANHQWAARPLDAGELELWFEAMMATGIEVACAHDSYLINLASPDAALRERSYRSLLEEVERCDILHVPNLVLHPGAHLGSGVEAGIERVAGALNRLRDERPDSDVCLCLETTAGTGTHLGSTFDELAAILDRVDDGAHAGVCLDTCHIFAAGYPIRDAADYAATMRRLDQTVGLCRLKVIHANDSRMPFGSRRDRHAHIGRGEIGAQGFRHFVTDPRLAHVPVVLETEKGPDLADDVRNLRLLRRLVREGGDGARRRDRAGLRSRA